MPKPHTPFQWFGQNTGAGAAAQGRPAARRDPPGAQRQPQVARPVGHRRRGHPQPRRPAHRSGDRAGVARRRHVPGVGRALRPAALDRRPGGRGPVARLVRPPPPRRGEVLPWAHLTAGLHEDFLWDDWQAALAASGVEDCRWTPCYDCGVCTGYGIEHVVASNVAPAGGSQGTGQDLAQGGAGPGDAAGAPAVKLRLRYAKLGKVRFTSHRDTARIWERAMRRAGVPVATSAGFTPRPRLSFGLALPTGAESVAEYLDAEVLDDVDDGGRPRGPAGAPGPRAAGRVRGAASWRCRSAGRARCRRRSRRSRGSSGRRRAGTSAAVVGGLLAADDAADRAGAQGRAPGRRRPPGDPGAHRRPTTAHWSPRWRPSGAACDRRSSPLRPSPAPT